MLCTLLLLSSSHNRATTFALQSDQNLAVQSDMAGTETMTLAEEATSLESLASHLEHYMTQKNLLKLAERHHGSNDSATVNDANLI